MPIQVVPIPDANVVAPILTLPQADSTSIPFEQHEVIEKGKKKKDAIRKRVKRMARNSSSEGSSQERAFLDDQEVIQSLMKDSILSYIVDKMVRKEDAERFDESFAAFLKLGHYLFAHLKGADLCQVKFSKALHKAQMEIERV
ncbi:putative ensconsin-like [Cocos nucifera]|uniref:Putative ensconsin-like n=1 Tax=Cocos nucifera TaxID=13894 RepID=A0A8K0MV53_COCNU|nr:putative ensconsin-like [Cocos nucifera]